MNALPEELRAIRERVAVFAKNIADPQRDTPESEYAAVELLSLLEAQSDEVRRLRSFIEKHAAHDWECPKHVCQWDANEQRGLPRHADVCECEYDTEYEALGSQP